MKIIESRVVKRKKGEAVLFHIYELLEFMLQFIIARQKDRDLANEIENGYNSSSIIIFIKEEQQYA